jgi:hypothetical protein
MSLCLMSYYDARSEKLQIMRLTMMHGQKNIKLCNAEQEIFRVTYQML